jgi:hypothetical protein
LILEISYVIPQIGNQSLKTPSIQIITAFNGGIIVGTSTGICVQFERTDDSYLYKKSKEFILEENPVCCIALSPSEDSAVCSTSNCQLYGLTLDADSSKVIY